MIPSQTLNAATYRLPLGPLLDDLRASGDALARAVSVRTLAKVWGLLANLDRTGGSVTMPAAEIAARAGVSTYAARRSIRILERLGAIVRSGRRGVVHTFRVVWARALELLERAPSRERREAEIAAEIAGELPGQMSIWAPSWAKGTMSAQVSAQVSATDKQSPPRNLPEGPASESAEMADPLTVAPRPSRDRSPVPLEAAARRLTRAGISRAFADRLLSWARHPTGTDTRATQDTARTLLSLCGVHATAREHAIEQLDPEDIAATVRGVLEGSNRLRNLAGVVLSALRREFGLRTGLRARLSSSRGSIRPTGPLVPSGRETANLGLLRSIVERGGEA